MKKIPSEKLKKGTKAGAIAGIVLFAVFGLLPGFYIGSYTALAILTVLSGGPVDPSPFVRFVIITGSIIGVLTVCSVFAVLGALTGTILAFVYFSLYSPVEYPEPKFIRKKHKISESKKKEILNELEFLRPFWDRVHSILLVGSVVYGADEEDSDIDIVIICKKTGCESIRDIIFEKEINEQLKGNKGRIEYTIIGPDFTRELFQIGSPFAYSIKNAVVLKDDGFLKRLLKEKTPPLPTRRYVLKMLHEYVAVQYYSTITEIERVIKSRNCSTQCCALKLQDCNGLPAAEAFRKLILRMLYITIPAKGYIPLCKKDTVYFTHLLYGPAEAKNIEYLLLALRQKDIPMFYNEYIRLKPFATGLFREVLLLTDRDKTVTTILKDAVNLVRGRPHRIKDRAFRECII